MKRLILLRHAKAEAKDAARDFDRALAPRGQAEARAMARALAALDPTPGLALVSPARRTRETWDLAGAELGAIPTTFEQAIYEATTRQLLRIVQAIDGQAACAIVVGHNPAFEELALALAAADKTTDRQALRRGMPTGAAAILDFDVGRWTEIAEGGGQLAAFLTPDGLGATKR